MVSEFLNEINCIHIKIYAIRKTLLYRPLAFGIQFLEYNLTKISM